MNTCNCNCNYILFTKMPWPGDSEGTFRSSSQAATCPPVYHTRWRLHTVPLTAERQAGKLWIPIFIVFGSTRLGIEPKSTVSVADALSTRPLFPESLVIDVWAAWLECLDCWPVVCCCFEKQIQVSMLCHGQSVAFGYVNIAVAAKRPRYSCSSRW